MEIRSHAVLQVDCFANVDDLPAGVLHQIAARFCRYRRKYGLDIVGDFHRLQFYFKYAFVINELVVTLYFIATCAIMNQTIDWRKI